MLDGELTVRADFAWGDFQMATQRVSHLIASCERADRRAADTCNGSAHRLARKHLVEIDNTINIGERHAQGAADFRCNGFGQSSRGVAVPRARPAGAQRGLAARTR